MTHITIIEGHPASEVHFRHALADTSTPWRIADAWP